MIKLKLACLDSLLEVEQPICCRLCAKTSNHAKMLGRCPFCIRMRLALKDLMKYQLFEITFEGMVPSASKQDSNPRRDNHHMPIKSPIFA